MDATKFELSMGVATDTIHRWMSNTEVISPWAFSYWDLVIFGLAAGALVRFLPRILRYLDGAL